MERKMMKPGNLNLRILPALAILTAAFSFIAASQAPSYPDFELVETVPVETALGDPGLRNPHDVWLGMIHNARQTIDFEEFYVSNAHGEPLEDIIGAILEAGKRGVEIRFIADSRMYRTYPETLDSLGKSKNISVRIINYGRLAGGVQHSKYFVVDGEEAFVGSQNFDWRSLEHIHELGLRIKHKPTAEIYEDIFNLDWALAEKNDPALISQLLTYKHYDLPFRIPEGGDDTLTFFPTASPKGLLPDSTMWDETNIVGLIDAAKDNIYCQFLTYSPITREKDHYYPVLNEALKRAAARGVHVHMIVSDWSKDHPLVDSLISLGEFRNIEIKFSDIPEWSKGYIPFARVEHCKYLAVDKSSSWIGTANWEKSYFYTTRNLGVVVHNDRITSTLERIFLKDWTGPYTELIKPGTSYTPRKHGEN